MSLESRLRKIEKAGPDIDLDALPRRSQKLMAVALTDSWLHMAALVKHAEGREFVGDGPFPTIDAIGGDTFEDPRWYPAVVDAVEPVFAALRHHGHAEGVRVAADIRRDQADERRAAGAPVRLLGVEL